MPTNLLRGREGEKDSCRLVDEEEGKGGRILVSSFVRPSSPDPIQGKR